MPMGVSHLSSANEIIYSQRTRQKGGRRTGGPQFTVTYFWTCKEINGVPQTAELGE